MRVFSVLAVAGVLLLASTVFAAHRRVGSKADPCSTYPNCTACTSRFLCGWCSEPIVYPHGRVPGNQCGGFEANGSIPFTCNGVFSIEQCTAGYTCNMLNFTCDMAPPGQGVPLEQCQASCTNTGQVFLCNETAKTCSQVPPNMPNNGSLALCSSLCIHPSARPSSPNPGPPPAQTYACNYTTAKCYPTTPGHGSSQQQCQATCTKVLPAYTCNHVVQQCERLPPHVPGPSKAQCEAVCNPKPNPGPPQQFMGLWRGIEIQNNYKVGEWDMFFNETTAIIINLRAAVTIKGIPTNVQSGDSVNLWINVTAGPPGYAGTVIKAIGETKNQGPETNFLTAALSAPNGAAPQSIRTAMVTPPFKVFFLSQCIGTPECHFMLPSGVGAEVAAEAEQEEVVFDNTFFSALKRNKVHKVAAVGSKHVNPADPCSQFDANCSQCLSQKYCGWCSQDVVYTGGHVGTQCAGFSQNPNISNPWVCTGRYSTFNCSVGYSCNQNTAQCVPNPQPGNGVPLADCELTCVTPAPTIVQKQYVCNITTKMCLECNETHCAGSMPLSTCEASCAHPHKGPSALVIGIWRGIQINNNYPIGEYELYFNSSSVTAYRNTKEIWAGTLTSYGGDLMEISVTSGLNAGSTLSAIYSIADQGAMYSVMTLATGAPNGDVPVNYAVPMQSPPQYEQVFAKCGQAPCQFTQP